MGLITVLAWVGLVLQFWISFYQSLSVGRSPLQSVLFYFGFFTILTNLLIALSLTLGLLVPRSRLGAFFTKPSVETGAAIYIAVVGIVYSLVLRELWNPVGVQKIADLLLHDAVPLLYIAFWATSVPKESLRYQDACWWSAYPLAYLLWALARGAATGFYPYPFIDLRTLGATRVALNGLLLLGLFLTLGFVAVAFAKWQTRHTSRSTR